MEIRAILLIGLLILAGFVLWRVFQFMEKNVYLEGRRTKTMPAQSVPKIFPQICFFS